MGKRKQRKFQEQNDPLDKEIKYFVTIVLIAFTLVSFMPLLGQQAQPLRFLDGIIQYADAAEFYIDPDALIFAHHDGVGNTCPVATGPASADNASPPSSNEFFLDDEFSALGCYYPIYIWDEGSLLPRIFDQYISDADRMFFKTDWGTTDWNSADSIGGGVGCTGLGVENFDDPRINVTDTYEAIRSNAAATATTIGSCDSDLQETSGIEFIRSNTLDEAYVNRVNDTYFAIGGRLGASGGIVRDGADRGVDLEITKVALKAAFQIPANHSNNWWQIQEHPMFINELGSPTGDQFSDNSPALIDSGFFGIDSSPFTFTFDTGLDVVERGQVVLFKQFNKTVIGEKDFRIQGGIQSVTALGDTKIRIEVRDHPVQAGQTQFFGKGLDTSLDGDVHDGQDYFNKNKPIKYINNGSLGVIDFEPTSLGAIEPFDISIKPEWTHSTNDIITLIVSLQDNSTTGSLIGNITSVEVEDIINYNFTDINELLFFEDDCSVNFANVDPVGNSGEGIVQNDENCGEDLGNGLINIENVTLTGAISGTLPTPAAVTGLSVGVITDDSLILNWSHDLIDTTGFKIDRDDGTGLVEYISNTAVGGPNGEGGSIETRFIDINYNVTAYPSRANAAGLNDNTQYSYRVCALNGDVVGTCSSTVAQTTPDSLPFWQIVEHSTGTKSGILMTHTGGDGDWIELGSGLTDTGDWDGHMFKSFNITELNLLEKNSVPQWHIDWQETDSGNIQVSFCNTEYNRFNTTIFEGGLNPATNCITTLGHGGHTWKDADTFGTAGAFKPNTHEITLNLNSTFFDSELITVMFSIRDQSAVDDKGFQIKNFTWVNSTTWEFESGNGANMNWTARINVDQENGDDGSHYTTPLFANCEIDGNPEKFIDVTYDCDEGTIKAATAAHQILQFTQGDDDWQYAETNGIEAIGLSFASISSNASGLVIDHSRSQGQDDGPTIEDPQTFSKFFIWKEFSKSVLQDGNMTISIRGEGAYTAGTDTTVTVLNTTAYPAEIDWTLDRWNAEQWSENGYGTVAGGPTPAIYCRDVLDDPNSCTITQMGTVTELTARDGEALTPYDPITVTNDFSAFTNVTDTILVLIEVRDNADRASGTTMIQNITVGKTTYNFTNSNIQNEVGEDQFLRVTAVNTDDYQFYTGVLGGDRGIITAGELLLEPPDPPTNLNATAVNPDVLLEWTASDGADDYKIERGSFPISTTGLKLDFEHDNGGGSADNIGPSSELTNSELCGVGTCNYSMPTLHLGTTQLGFAFAGIVNESARWGISGSAAAALNTTNVSDWDFLNTGDWSVGWWMIHSAESGQSTFVTTINDAGTGSGSSGGFPDRDGFSIHFNDDTQVMRVFTMENDLTTSFNETSPTLFIEEDAAFHHYFITHDLGNEVKWYKDGVLIETDSSIGTSTGEADIGVIIGNCWNSAGCSTGLDTTFSGGSIEFPTRVDQTLFFNRTITSSEVSAVYNSGSGLIIDSSFLTIVPSLIDANLEFVSDDFSSYISNATADLTWIPTIAGTDSADDVIGVNVTDDKIYFWSNPATASNIVFDLQDLLGQNLTDNTGSGDFNMTWTQDLQEIDGTCAKSCATSALFIALTDRITTWTGTQTGVNVGYFYQGLNPSFEDDIAMYVSEDQNGSTLDEFNGNCNNHGPNPDPEKLFHKLTRIGNQVNYAVGIDATYGECSIGHTLTETIDDIQYLILRRQTTGSDVSDHGFRFDDFAISTNGTLVNFYYDRTVDLGTNYQFKVSALNTVFQTESAPSSVADVLTNDVPTIIENILTFFTNPNQIDIQWDDLPFDSGIGFVSSGLNLTKYQVFRENVTAGTPFELITEILASSPPPNFYNDTTISFPDVFNYQSSGCNAVGCGTNSTTSQAVVVSPPSAVLDTPIFNATAVDSTVSLDWNDATFSINYTVLRNNTIIAQGVPNSNFIDATVLVNTNYNYSAYGVNNNGNGTEGFSNTVLTNDLPTTPLNFNVTMGLFPPYLETPILNWTFPLDEGEGDPSSLVPILNFTVDRKQGIGAFSFLKNETSRLQNGTTDDTAAVAANYTWRVQSCNVIGCSPFSNTDSLIVTPTTVPPAPSNLTANTLSGSEIFLDWTAPVTNASNQPTEYRVQQRYVGFTGFVSIADTGNTNTEYTAISLVSGGTYDFRVAGLSGAGQGNYSNIAQNVTFTVPTAPLNLQADTLNKTAIFLDWDEPTVTNGEIIKYNIEQESPIGNGFSEIAEVSQLPSADFFDDFTTNKGWVSNNTVNADVYTATGTLNVTDVSTGNNVDSKISLNIDDLLTGGWNQDKWTLRAKHMFNFSSAGGNSGYYTLLGVSSVDQEAMSGTQDNGECVAAAAATIEEDIGCLTHLGVANDWRGGMRNATDFSNTNLNITNIDSQVGSFIYPEIIVDGNFIRWTVYSDSEYQNVLGCSNDKFDDSSGECDFEHSSGVDLPDPTNRGISQLDRLDDDVNWTDLKYLWFGQGQTDPFNEAETGSQGAFHEVSFWNGINMTEEEVNIVVGSVATEYTVTGLTTKTEYNFRVNAENDIGTSPYSNEAANTTFGVPDAPINEDGDTNGINEITISWDEGVSNFGSAVTGYRIDQAVQGGTWFTAINDTGNNVEPLEETFVGLVPQTTYTYRIFSYNSFGISLPTANLTQGTFAGPTEPENFFAVFNATKPYSVNLSWAAPLNDGGRPIIAYLIQRQNEASVFVQIANVTNSTFAYTDTNLLNLATHTYRIAAQTNPVGSFTPDQPVVTFVPANIVNFTIDEFGIVGDVLQQNYSFVVDDCFPTCTLSQADIERNGLVESNIVFSEAVPLDTTIEFTTWFILPTAATSSVNTTAFVTNLGGSGDDEAGVTLATAEFLVPTSLFFNHTRTPDFEDIEFQLIRHPVPWEVTCEHTIASGLSPSIFGISGTQPIIQASGVGVGYLNETINANPQANSYIACFDPSGVLNKVQILSFTSFGLGNGTFALISFTNQLGDFLGVPVAFVFVIFLAAIWTGRSASTGVIFLAVAIGFMGVLGYFPDVSGDPLLTGGFWSLIVLMTALGVFMGKRFF